MSTPDSIQPDQDMTAGRMLGALDLTLRAAYYAGLIDNETMTLAYGGLIRHELLERSRHRQTDESKESIEDRLSHPEPVSPPWLEPNTAPQTPADITQWLLKAVQAADWAASAQVQPLGERAVHQHMIRISAKDGTVHRLGLSENWDPDLTQDFDSIFPQNEPPPATGQPS